MRFFRRLFFFLLGAAGLAALDYFGHRWGATEDEATRPLPGDAAVPNPLDQTTHAVTVNAPPEAIWPWLVQAGYHRGGWYDDPTTAQVFMRYFFNILTPADERAEYRPSAERLLPEYQGLKVGDIVPDGPPDTAYFTVVDMAANRHLVLLSDTHIPSLNPHALRGKSFAPWGTFSWVFVLEEFSPGATRLILRTRAVYGPPLFRLFGWLFFMVGELVFPYQILHGIRRRAEALAAGELAPA